MSEVPMHKSQSQGLPAMGTGNAKIENPHHPTHRATKELSGAERSKVAYIIRCNPPMSLP